MINDIFKTPLKNVGDHPLSCAKGVTLGNTGWIFKFPQAISPIPFNLESRDIRQMKAENLSFQIHPSKKISDKIFIKVILMYLIG